MRYYPDGSGQPPSTDEVELGMRRKFDDAIKLINADMLHYATESIMENAYFENCHLEEETGEVEQTV